MTRHLPISPGRGLGGSRAIRTRPDKLGSFPRAAVTLPYSRIECRRFNHLMLLPTPKLLLLLALPLPALVLFPSQAVLALAVGYDVVLLLVAGLTVLLSAGPRQLRHRAAAAGTPFAGGDEPGGLGDPQLVRHGGPFRGDRGRAGIARAGDAAGLGHDSAPRHGRIALRSDGRRGAASTSSATSSSAGDCSWDF